IAVSYEDGKVILYAGEDIEAPEETPKKLSASLLGEEADSRDVKYEGKAIYMSFDIIYTFDDLITETDNISFIGERKWIQNYKWRLAQ
ncbi:MAG: hypothetical protein IKK99_05295, partial [Oscillospiraceae bacterium]|nr:hypothetical protein [Oscillospiraceae bacterium]